jgi:hypothetical protein
MGEAGQRMPLSRRTSRRQFLGLGAALVAAAAGLGATCEPPPPPPSVQPRGRAAGPRHLSWVWQSSSDGSPNQIVPVLAQHNLGILLKTHDGTDWMSRYDDSPFAVSGADQVGVLARYYETYGVPFHAWCVVKGLDPKREAEMCAQVIGAGARSITIDVEPHSGFWQGTQESARAFGDEFRRRLPGGTLHVSVDPRPWVMDRIPVAEFASFAQGFVPQVYWETFNTSSNRSRFESSGYPPGAQGITPEFLLDVSHDLLGNYGLPILPAGQGASRNNDAWRGFVDRAFGLGMEAVSSWRHGVTGADVWRLLRDVGTLPGLSKGARARVENTFSCLNVREAPTLGAAVLYCMADGTDVTVVDGPVAADGYRWWFVDAGVARGWSAEADPGGVRWLVPLR